MTDLPDCQSAPRIGAVPAALRAVTDRTQQARGRAQEFQRLFQTSHVPMVVIDNERRYRDVNMPAQLLFRLPESKMRAHRVDDLTSPSHWPAMLEAWEHLMRHGEVSGKYVVRFRDGSRLCIDYAATANFLPGLHVIVFTPARWPEAEMPTLTTEGVRRETPMALSPRQREVMRMVARGYDVPQIARELSLSEATVRTHVRDAMRRLGANNRAHAVALAISAGAIP